MTEPATTPQRDTPATRPPRPPRPAAQAAARWIEMLALFFALPAIFALIYDPAQRARPFLEAFALESVYDAGLILKRSILLILLLVTALITIILIRDPCFDNRRLWNSPAFKRDLPRILAVFAVCAPIMLATAWALQTYTDIMTVTGRDGVETSAFLRLPREMPIILVVIAIGYPWISAYPQEILCRAFFFHRYAPLVNTPALIAINAIAFAWLHALFWSIEAIILTLPGGLLFTWTYLRTKSTLAAGVEHALYGFWAFFTGLGWFVFTGSIGN